MSAARKGGAMAQTSKGDAMISKLLKGTVALAAALAAGAAMNPAQAVDFAGKRITMIIPYQEGSGSTIHGRLFAMALEKTLPGNPTIVIRNIDGGGSVRGINQFHKDAKPDGLMIGAIATGTFFQYILKDKAVAYPLPEFKPFLTSPFGLIAYARTDLGLGADPVEHVRKLVAKPPVYGGSGPTSSDLPALLSYDLLGIRPKGVYGLSNAESRAGFERGEFNLKYDNAASWAEEVKPLVDSGQAKVLFTLGFEQADGKIVRDPMLPDVPTFLELYEKIHGKPLSGIEYDVWKALFNVRVMGSKMFVLPVGTPKEIVDVYTKATDEALKSDILNSPQAKLVLGAYPQSTGAASEAVFKGGLSMTAEQQAWLRNWLRERHDVTIN
jgi:tripartite-type tricarboxylate transporter receptor subunit TctC